MESTDEKKYYAFISYSTQDEKWAKWLHRGLEYYRIPSVLCKENPELPKMVRPVFWYKHDLSGTRLKESLYRELEKSRYLIVICSPNAAKSEWVNDEITAFIEQGKGDKIIPFIVDGEPHSSDSEKECFLPALRNLPREQELRGIDPRSQGKSHAIVDVVATMFGLAFDVLWQRHRRRYIRRCIYFGVILLFALLSGFFYWDYTRATYKYFADYIDVWGVPQGVMPLNEQQVAKRNISCRFEYRRIPFGEPGAWGWRLQKVTFVNSAGTPQQNNDVGYSIQDIVYSTESGIVIRINYCDVKGNVLIRHDLSEYDGVIATIADLTASAEEKGAAFAAAATTGMSVNSMDANQTKSNIIRYAYNRDAQGRIVRQTFHANNDYDLSKSITADGDGICGFAYTLDSLGRRVKTEYLDIDGRPCCNKKGIAGTEDEYDIYGNLSKRTYYDLNGNPVLNEEFWSMAVYVANENGNIIETTLYDEDGKPCLGNYGVHKMLVKYDDRGNKIERCYYDVDGSPCLDKDGCHKWTAKYDVRGNRIEVANYDVDGSPCLHKDGCHKWTAKYDVRGNCIEVANYDVDGSPCLDKDGYHKAIIKYDNYSYVTEKSFYGVDGAPCMLQSEGLHRVIFKYTSVGLQTLFAFYDTEGNLCMSVYGYAKGENIYNDKNICTATVYYNSDDCVIRKEKHIYNDRNERIETEIYNDKGEVSKLAVVPLVIGVQGYAATMGIPVNSLILKCGDWTIGEPISKLYEIMNRGFNNTEFIFASSDGKIYPLFAIAGNIGVSYITTELDRLQIDEYIRIYENWKADNKDK